VKTNWPLFGIILGALATAGLIIAMFVSSTTTTSVGLGLPTMSLVGDAPIVPTSRETTGTLAVAANGCFYVDYEESASFAIWPDGYTQDDTEVVSPDGDRLGAGATVTGEFVVVDKSTVNATGSLEASIDYCTPDEDSLILLTALNTQ
jgi:hypothetical protein